MSNWDYAGQTPTAPWRGAMTIPRVVGLTKIDGNFILTQQPIDELQNLRGQNTHFQNVSASSAKPQFDNLKRQAFELKTTLEPDSASQIGFKFRKSNTQETVVTYDVATETLLFDRSKSGLLGTLAAFNPVQKVPLKMENGQVTLDIFVDNTSIEIFANGGKTVLTNQIFPDSASLGMEIFTVGGAAQIVNLDIWEMGKANFLPTKLAVLDTSVLVFPNPLNAEKLTIELPENWQKVEISVSDAGGKPVFQSRNDAQNRRLELPKTAFPNPGTYFLTISHDGETVVKKVIRQQN